MRYHNITKDDMLNGQGLRVVLWSSGCSHKCLGCQNPITWDPNCGLLFDEKAKEEIFDELSKDYISGITFSGGDPLFKSNLSEILSLIKEIKEKFPNKNIWMYTGYTWEAIFNKKYDDLIDKYECENEGKNSEENKKESEIKGIDSKENEKTKNIEACTKEECGKGSPILCGKMICLKEEEYEKRQTIQSINESEYELAREMLKRREILSYIDVLVDGPFILSQRNVQLHWKGSPNQRVIDVQATLNSGDIKICEE